MKVCLVGHFTFQADEGVRNVGKSIATELRKRGEEIKVVDVSNFWDWSAIRSFRPEIVHFILSPTVGGLFAAKLLSLFVNAKTVVSAVHPAVPAWGWVGLFKPDLMLIQSERSGDAFKSLGFETQFLPNGVDTERFRPVDAKKKRELRLKYNIPIDKFVVLHLASLTKERNLRVFTTLQSIENVQSLIVGRETENSDKSLLRELHEAKCILRTEHFSHVQEIYQLSDCYLFPTVDPRACIELPLSVLEAMACNVPVLTTPFGGLPQLFKAAGDGITFVEKEEDFIVEIVKLKEHAVEQRAREYALPFAWKNIVNELATLYEKLLDSYARHKRVAD